MILSRFFLVGLIGLSAVGGSGIMRADGLEKREPHLRLRARMQSTLPRWEFDRWFMPGELGFEASPLATSSKLLASQPTERAFLTRALGGVDAEWGAFNQLTRALKFSHNLSRVVPAELFDEKPELYPLIQGQRWRPTPGRFNWNPDLGEAATVEVSVAAAAAYFTQNPESLSFALGINDGLRFGESPATLRWVSPTRWFRDRPDYSDLVFQYMNRVAQRLEAAWPDKYVGALAYYWTENTPSFPLHPRVIPFLTADRSQFYDAAFKREELELQKRWSSAFAEVPSSKYQVTGNGNDEPASLSGELGAKNSQLSAPLSSLDIGPSTVSPSPRLGLYDYIYGVGFLIPRIHTEYLAEHLRHARDVGFTDYYAEMSPNWGIDGPQPWLVAQLLSDPTADADELLDEYYHRFFRSAAKPMRQFFERCEKQWMRQPGPSYWLKHFKNDSQAEVFPSHVCRDLRKLLEEAAERASRAGDTVVGERIRFVSDAWGLTERYVLFCEARIALQEGVLLLGSEGRKVEGRKVRSSIPAGLTLSEKLDHYRSMRAAFVRYADWIRAEHPLAFTRMLLDVFLRHDPGPTAAALIASKRRSEDSEQEPEFRIHGWSGEVRPGLEIAGLPYEFALPTGYTSSIEPWKGLSAEFKPLVSGAVVTKVLRLENHKLSSIVRGYHAPISDEGKQLGGWGVTVDVRGRLSESAFLSLTLRAYDENMAPLGPPVDTKLLAGNHAEWTRLVQYPEIPEGTQFIGLTLWCAHQQPGDWLEIGEPRTLYRADL